MSPQVRRGAYVLIGGAVAWLAIGFLSGSLCWFQATIGFPCPACGTMRATYELLRGEVLAALNHHPLIFATLGFLVYGAFFFFSKKRNVGKTETVLLVCFGLFYLALYAIRMHQYFPYTEPFVPNENALARQAGRFLLGLFGGG